MSNKGTKAFNDTIKSYLDARAQSDPLFAASYAKEGKSIEECCNYIFQEVQKSNFNGFTDDEIFGIAVHYYDEDDLGPIKATNCRVVVNHTVELTEEEIEQARKDAIAQVQKEEANKLRSQNNKVNEEKKVPAKPKAEPAFASPSLFDFGDEGEE